MAYWKKNGSTKLKLLSVGQSWNGQNIGSSWGITSNGDITDTPFNANPNIIPGSLDSLQTGYCYWSATQEEVWGFKGNNIFRYNADKKSFDDLGTITNEFVVSPGATPITDTPTAVAVGQTGVFVLGEPNLNDSGFQYIYVWGPTDWQKNVTEGKWYAVAFGIGSLSHLCTGYLRENGDTISTLWVLQAKGQGANPNDRKIYRSQLQVVTKDQFYWAPWQEITGSMAQIEATNEYGPVGVNYEGVPYSWEFDNAGTGNCWVPQKSQTPPPPLNHISLKNPALTMVTTHFGYIYGLDDTGQPWIYSN